MMSSTERRITPLENAIALRVTSVCYASAFVIALSDVAAGYWQFRSEEYTFFGFCFSVLYLACQIVTTAGLHTVARLAFVVLICAHCGITLWFVGPYTGVEIYIIGILLVPLLIFSKLEKCQFASAYAIILVGVVVAEYVTSRSPPHLVLDEAAKRSVYLVSLLAVAFVVTCIITFYSRASVTNFLQLQSERNKSEQMLRDLLPEAVANQLIRGEQFVAQSNGECTVLFADLVGFTSLSEKLSPIHLVELLNDVFSEIDKLCEEHGIEKIKTIGDCYMAAAGTLETRSQPIEMVHLGMSIIEVVRQYAEKTGYPLAVRVGINTGQVVSGIIGSKRRLFDIWGQTVNMAQLLESKRRRNGILVSESMQWRLRSSFQLSEPIELQAKSGHAFTGYYVEGHMQLAAVE